MDYEHLKSIHRELFKDVYVWAGMDRYEIGYRDKFRKGSTYFIHGNKLPTVASELFASLKEKNHFKKLNRNEMIESMAHFLNELNILHPFREGNGRAQRLFAEELSRNAGYELNLSCVDKSLILEASIEGANGNISKYEEILKNHLIPSVSTENDLIFEEYISFTIESELEGTGTLSDDTKERIHAYGSLMEDKALMDAVRSTDSEDLAVLGEYFQELSQNDYVDYDTFGSNQIQEMR